MDIVLCLTWIILVLTGASVLLNNAVLIYRSIRREHRTREARRKRLDQRLIKQGWHPITVLGAQMLVPPPPPPPAQ